VPVFITFGIAISIKVIDRCLGGQHDLADGFTVGIGEQGAKLWGDVEGDLEAMLIGVTANDPASTLGFRTCCDATLNSGLAVDVDDEQVTRERSRLGANGDGLDVDPKN
jgi:hypothetical protein